VLNGLISKLVFMHILALSGSLRPSSANTALLHAAAAMAPAGTTITLYPSLAQLPYFMPGGYDLEPAPAVADFRAQLQEADAVLICTPEYVFSMPGVLKNALEWLVASAELYHKPVAIWSASPSPSGGEQAHESVVRMLTVMEAAVVEAAALMVAGVSAKVNKQGEVTDPALQQSLREAVQHLVAAAHPPLA
jgi:chromate reductase